MNHDDRCKQAMSRRVSVITLVTAITFAAAASTASAQIDRQVDLSAGYLNVSGSMHGGTLQTSIEMAPGRSFVGEFNAAYGSYLCTACVDYLHLGGLVGFRFASNRTARYSTFWQVLAGGLHERVDDYYVDYCCGLPSRLQEGPTHGYFVFQPGIGMTAKVTSRFGIRAQADFQIAMPNGDNTEHPSPFPRAVVGAVIQLGKK
jgi:hypothetical protein